MGELLGIPEWLALTLWVSLVLTLAVTWGLHSIRKAHRKLAEKRPDPSHDQFVDLLAPAVASDVAEWMWNCLLPYYRPMTPHPNDHLFTDARIDEDDVTMDWLPRFAEDHGLDWKAWPDWPDGEELTVHNFARWLQQGRDALAS